MVRPQQRTAAKRVRIRTFDFLVNPLKQAGESTKLEELAGKSDADYASSCFDLFLANQETELNFEATLRRWSKGSAY